MGSDIVRILIKSVLAMNLKTNREVKKRAESEVGMVLNGGD